MEDIKEMDFMSSISIPVTPSFSSFLERHADIVSITFSNALREEVHFTLIQKDLVNFCGSKTALNKVEFMLMDEPVKLCHSIKMKAWLTQNSETWLTFTNFLMREYLCAIHTEEDFSKSYFFIAPHHDKQISDKIKDFLLANNIEVLAPEDKVQPVSVYKPFIDFLKTSKEMAALFKIKKPSSPDTPLVEIDISQESLKILRSKLERVTSQSCLLSESQATLLIAIQDEILSDIQTQYQVIGNIFQPDSPMKSLVLNRQTHLICAVSSQPDYSPVDNYIRLECHFSHRPEEYTVVNKLPGGDTIWKGETWNLPFNQRLLVQLPSMQTNGGRVNYTDIFTKCFKILNHDYDINSNGFRSKITGIYLPVLNDKVLKQLCINLVTALNLFDQKDLPASSKKCIALIVDTPEIQAKIVENVSSEISYINLKNILHGAIPKTSLSTQQKIMEEKPVLWVQFYNISDTSENINSAVYSLNYKLTETKDNHITTCVIKIHSNKLKSLLFFFEQEITKVVPDIKDQFSKSKGQLITHVIAKTSQTNIRCMFKELLKKIYKTQIDVQNIKEKSLLKHIESEFKYDFPNMKCTYMEERSCLFLESLSIENLTKVKIRIMRQLDQVQDYEQTYKELPVNIQESFEHLPRNIQESLDSEEMFEQLPINVQEFPEELSVYTQGNDESDLESEQTNLHLNFPTIRVLYDDICSVNLDAVACPVFGSVNKMTSICQLLINQAGDKIKEELVAWYNEYPDKILPEGAVMVTSAGNLKYKLIFYVCYPEYDSENEEDIQKILTKAMCNLLNKVEQRCLRSLAVPILGSENFYIPLDLYLESSLGAIVSFINQHSERHLQMINFIGNQEYNCAMTINIFNIYNIHFKHNLNRKENQIQVNKHQTLVPCPLCFKAIANAHIFDDCQHEYCSECISEWLQDTGEICPLCLNMKPQPPGQMITEISEKSLPGFEDFQTYHITYNVPKGIQLIIHPNPGELYQGTRRKAFLPANEKGTFVLKMLQRAFKQHFIFTVGDSLSSKKSNVVIWNGILHKTRQIGGPSRYGYPDYSYLDYVLDQLKQIGITPESVKNAEIESEIKITAFG